MNNAAIAFSTTTGATTMTSREIAKLTGKMHQDVRRDIRNMHCQLEKDVSSFAAVLPDTYGCPQPIYKLPKDLTITLVPGYASQHTASLARDEVAVIEKTHVLNTGLSVIFTGRPQEV